MAALTPTNVPYRHVAGDMVMRVYNLAGNNGDTFTPPGVGWILFTDPQPTTAISIGTTIVGNIITFITAGAWTAAVQVWSRYG